jgi:hypothetical protein
MRLRIFAFSIFSRRRRIYPAASRELVTAVERIARELAEIRGER